MRTLRQWLQWASDRLQPVSDSASLDSEVLLAHCLDKDRAYLLTWPERNLTEQQENQFRELVRRRLEPQPVAYLVGHREFYSLKLKTTPATLVPRPETEMLVDEVLALVSARAQCRLLDLGTGTGAIALAVKQHAPQCEVLASDISPGALAVARENGAALGLDVEWIESDWFQNISPKPNFDLVVSNPPYIAEGDPYLDQGDLPGEPELALVSGKQGLDAIEILVFDALDYLAPGGWLLFEHGYDQRQAVASILEGAGYLEVACKSDFNNLPRVSRGRKSLS